MNIKLGSVCSFSAYLLYCPLSPQGPGWANHHLLHNDVVVLDNLNFSLSLHWVEHGGYSMLAVADLQPAFTASEVLLAGKADLQQIQQAASLLRSKLQKFRCLPVALGSAQTSLAHKLKASAHADRMESESWEQVACLARNTFARTGDFGTESGMSGSCANLRGLFGSWIFEAGFILGPQKTVRSTRP